jgi:hypothetical protein
VSVLEWLWRAHALQAAQRNATDLVPAVQQRLKWAGLAAELAGRALDPVDPLSGPGAALAVSLYREAAFWALLAQDAQLHAPNLDQAFASTPHELLVYAAGGEHELANVRAALIGKSFVDTTSDEPASAERDARLAKAFVSALIERCAGPAARVRRVRVERWLRTGSVVVLLLTALIGGNVALSRMSKGKDLALGKPWRTSSKFADCEPQHMQCGGKRTAIFFHTNDEENPWFELDFGKLQSFGAIEVDNRDDCCPDRAIPMIVEVSNDKQKWKQVGRRDDPFRTFHMSFTPVSARYLRLRIPRHVAFHLERVSVYEK